MAVMMNHGCASTIMITEAKEVREIICEYNKLLGGLLTDAETMKQVEISQKNFCKYAKKLYENTT